MIFPYVKQANTKMQVHKYTNTEHTTKWQKKTCGIFLKQLYNSSNMINAESAQFTRSSLTFSPSRSESTRFGSFLGGGGGGGGGDSFFTPQSSILILAMITDDHNYFSIRGLSRVKRWEISGLPKSTSMPHLSPAAQSKCRPCRSSSLPSLSSLPLNFYLANRGQAAHPTCSIFTLCHSMQPV